MSHKTHAVSCHNQIICDNNIPLYMSPMWQCRSSIEPSIQRYVMSYISVGDMSRWSTTKQVPVAGLLLSRSNWAASLTVTGLALTSWVAAGQEASIWGGSDNSVWSCLLSGKQTPLGVKDVYSNAISLLSWVTSAAANGVMEVKLQTGVRAVILWIITF